MPANTNSKQVRQAADPAALIGQRVRVHLNLHLARAGVAECFSVANPTTGTVILNARTVVLNGVEYKASLAGWKRIQRLGKRKVVAYAVGTLTALDVDADTAGRTEVTYNPNRRWDFHTRQGDQIVAADNVIFANQHSFAVNPR